MTTGIEMLQITIVEEDPVPLEGEDLAEAQEFSRAMLGDDFGPENDVEFMGRAFGINVEQASYPIGTRSDWESLIAKNRDALLELCEDVLDNPDPDTAEGDDFAMKIIPVGDDVAADDHFPVKPGTTLGYLTIGRKVEGNILVFSDASVDKTFGSMVFERWLKTRIQ